MSMDVGVRRVVGEPLLLASEAEAAASGEPL
jgi:hypothetical protein